MKIGVISDTHGNVNAWRRATAHFDGVDLIIHAGDVLYHPPRLGWSEGYDIPAFAEAVNGSSVPIVFVQGNCDPHVYEELLDTSVHAPNALVEHGGVRIFVMHGHLFGLKGQVMTREQMIEAGRRAGADYFVSGHTHVPVLDDVGGLVLMNPGSPSIPKFEISGEPAPSVGIIAGDGAKIININDGSVIMEVKRGR